MTKLDLTKPLRFRNYHPKVHLCGVYDDHFVIRYNDNGDWYADAYGLDGMESDGVSDYDIINVPEEPKKHVFWINFYLSDDESMAVEGCAYESRNSADIPENIKYETSDMAVNPERIACVRVEFTEGQFDE